MLQRSIFCVLMSSFFASCSETSPSTAKANILVPEVINKGLVYDSTLIDSIEIKNIGQPELRIA